MCLEEAVQREVITMEVGPAEIAQKENLVLQEHVVQEAQDPDGINLILHSV
jgi:hypothetical protein